MRCSPSVVSAGSIGLAVQIWNVSFLAPQEALEAKTMVDWLNEDRGAADDEERLTHR